MSDELWHSFDHKVLMGGMGDDTAMLIAELYARGLEPDEIVFCDTESEFPHTYKFIEYLKKWSEEKKWSKIVILNKLDKDGEPLSVIGNCINKKTLPAVAFGSKSCSLRFKMETADLYFNNSEKCHLAWGVNKKGINFNLHTGKILRMVGINYDEPQRVNSWKNQPKWVQVFPLFDWEIGEKESENVEKVGLYYPGKSSCTVCPNMSHAEIAMLRDEYPLIFKQSLSIESNYRKTSLIKSKQTDLFTEGVFDNTVMGLGGRNGKTWKQMLHEYDENPQYYKVMSDKKPCGCGH